MNLVLAVSPRAREQACQKPFLICWLPRIAFGSGAGSRQRLEVTSLSEAFGPRQHFFTDFAVEALCHLAIPECDKGAPMAFRRNGTCCVCMMDLQAADSTWSCHICCQGMHGECAQKWLSQWRRCPYCRAMSLPDTEVKNIVRTDEVLEALNWAHVAHDISLQFRISLFLVQLACWKQDLASLEALQERGFFQQLVAATEAASQQLEWPDGSNSFPLTWKMAITIEQLARHGYASCVLGVLQPLLAFLCRSDNEHQQGWCIRALRTLISNTDSSTQELVDDLLVAEAGDDFNAECLVSELRPKLFSDGLKT